MNHISMIGGRNIPGLGILVVLICAAWSTNAPAQEPASSAQATEALCRACHAEQFEALESNPHTVLQNDDWTERTGRTPACLNCHGDVSQHIAEGGGLGNVFAFRTESAIEKADACLDCHASTHPQFARSPHALAGLACTNCHSQHAQSPSPPALLRQVAEILGRQNRIGASSRLCLDCHQDKLAAFELNERHRLIEGVLECVSCHNPHEPATRNLLGGFKRGQCADCHTDKGGPFVFEHPASRVEGCTACHSPHGSPNRHLLKHQRVAELCISCHAVVPQFHLGVDPAAPTRFDLDTQCTNCHSSIHGSNLHPRFLR